MYGIRTLLHKTELCYEYESSTIEVRNPYLTHKMVLHSEYKVVQSRYGIRPSLHREMSCYEDKVV